MPEMLDNLLDATAPAAAAQTTDLMDDFISSTINPTEETPAEPATIEGETPAVDTPPVEETPAVTTEEEVVPETPSKRKDWDTLRSSRDRWKQDAEEVKTTLQTKEQTIQTLSTQLEELKAKVAKLPELEDKLKDFDVYEKELSVTRLEATREYRENIAKPLQVLGESAGQLAKANSTDNDTVENVMLESDPVKQREMFKEATAGWDDVDRSDLWGMVKDARTLLDKQELMRNNATAAAKEQGDMASRREQAEKDQYKAAFANSTKDVAKQLREKTPFIPVIEGETEEDRYKLLEQRVAEVDFDAQTPRGKAFAAATAILHPKMVQTIGKLQAEVAALQARVKAANSGKASVTPNEQSNAPATEAQDFLTAMGVPTNSLSHPLNVVGR
jgi:chromosome segregation ATPase